MWWSSHSFTGGVTQIRFSLLLVLVSVAGSTYLIGPTWVIWSPLSQGILTFALMGDKQFPKSKIRLPVLWGGALDVKSSWKDKGSKEKSWNLKTDCQVRSLPQLPGATVLRVMYLKQRYTSYSQPISKHVCLRWKDERYKPTGKSPAIVTIQSLRQDQRYQPTHSPLLSHYLLGCHSGLNSGRNCLPTRESSFIPTGWNCLSIQQRNSFCRFNPMLHLPRLTYNPSSNTMTLSAQGSVWQNC